MIVDFLKTKRSKEELRTALEVLREFRGCESNQEYSEVWFAAWKKLEQLEEFLAHLVDAMKVADLEGEKLNYWVARAEGPMIIADSLGKPTVEATYSTALNFSRFAYSPSTNWSQGGPIIEREGIAVVKLEQQWLAFMPSATGYAPDRGYIDVREMDVRDSEDGSRGSTPLIAAMRAYVAGKLGAEVVE